MQPKVKALLIALILLQPFLPAQSSLIGTSSYYPCLCFEWEVIVLEFLLEERFTGIQPCRVCHLASLNVFSWHTILLFPLAPIRSQFPSILSPTRAHCFLYTASTLTSNFKRNSPRKYWIGARPPDDHWSVYLLQFTLNLMPLHTFDCRRHGFGFIRFNWFWVSIYSNKKKNGYLTPFLKDI